MMHTIWTSASGLSSCMGRISAGWWHTELFEARYWEGY
nr:MAG TPA: hypothetical protein [Caudoviricetes sp.]